MEPTINSYSEISNSNYEKIKNLLLDKTIPIDFKSELINLIKDHSSKTSNPPIAQLIETGMVPVLIDIRSQFPPDEKTILNILWIITNIFTGNKSDIDYVINEKGIEYILEYIPNDNKEIVHQAVWGLSNIAGESTFHRDLILKLNVVDKIFHYFKEETDLPILRTLAWFISNLSRGHPLVDYELLKPCTCMGYLSYLWMFCVDEEIILDVLWSVSFISEINSKSVEDLINSNLIQNIVNEKFPLMKTKQNLMVPFLRTLGNIVSGDEASTWFMINLGILDQLVPFLEYSVLSIRKETAFIFSNIAAGSAMQVTAVVNIPNILEKIQMILTNDDIKVKTECVWIIMNLLSHKLSGVGEKLSQTNGLMEVFLKIYKDFDHSAEIQENLLENYKLYYQYLKENGGLEKKIAYKQILKGFVEELKEKNGVQLDDLEDEIQSDSESDLEKMNNLKVED